METAALGCPPSEARLLKRQTGSNGDVKPPGERQMHGDDGRPEGGRPDIFKIQIPCHTRKVRDFHKPATTYKLGFTLIPVDAEGQKPRLARCSLEAVFCFAPNPVTGL